MIRLTRSVTFRLAVVCGVLIGGAVVLIGAIFYFGTVGVQLRNVDRKIGGISDRLVVYADRHALTDLAHRIDDALIDGIDSDTEIYFLADARGARLAGNIFLDRAQVPQKNGIFLARVLRNGKPSSARMDVRRLTDEAVLVVGRDMGDVDQIERQVWRSILIGGVLALVMAVFGSLLLRRLIEQRVHAIRHTAAEIGRGNLHERIPLSGADDEFSRLGKDINRMLDRIEQLMDGVRHVSNAIAHNLRTPLGAIRNQLEHALHGEAATSRFAETGRAAIGQIDALIVVLQKLLQIAEAESGTRRQPFEAVALRAVIEDMVEFYDAAAEQAGIELLAVVENEPAVFGDRHLIDSMLINLLDNAFKYAGNGARIEVRARATSGGVLLEVRDNGPGIAAIDRKRVLERFFRARHDVSGTGLGLPIVAAIASLHGAILRLEDASPGLCVGVLFPPIEAETFPNGNPPVSSRRN
ncbi:MAG: HAMP domain-containing histidine kinase [Proteobacteria bacterium]|nr:HAMP domain-containing histidine kinase [Pseudomonadota bacterium]